MSERAWRRGGPWAWRWAVTAAVASLGAVTAGGCGPSVRTAGLRDLPGGAGDAAALSPTEPFLVQVVERPPDRPARRVSVSVANLSRATPAPPTPDAATREAMRAQAGARGAQVLVLSRLDTPWRKAFYGVGYRYLPAGAGLGDEHGPPPPCDQPAAEEAVDDARAEALRCMEEARGARPALAGWVEVVFDVDAFGDVMRAAATPASSRDGALQRCALRAVFHQDYGHPEAPVCRGTLRAELGAESVPPPSPARRP